MIFPLSWFITWDMIPKPKRIKIYTSGCPKNQNKCWYKIGFPFPKGLKKFIFKLLSRIIIVIVLDKTGIEMILACVEWEYF